VALSQKSQYAVRAVFELAKRAGTGPVNAAKIAAAEVIPVRFLENILSQLRQAGIVESVRGKEGGYLLHRRPEEISVGEVIRLVQGPMVPVECTGPNGGPECRLRAGCVLLPMWERAHQAMMGVYEGTTFKDLVDEERAKNGCEVLNYAI
jgi:Rrf2 family transcriptional regulator, cysteine metabolism repressor